MISRVLKCAIFAGCQQPFHHPAVNGPSPRPWRRGRGVELVELLTKVVSQIEEPGESW